MLYITNPDYFLKAQKPTNTTPKVSGNAMQLYRPDCIDNSNRNTATPTNR